MLSYSWGMTSNKCGCEAQTPSLVPPIEASPLLIYSHFGQPNGGVRRPSPNEAWTWWVVGQAFQPDLREWSGAPHDVAGEDEAGTAPFSGSESSGRFSSLIRR